MCSLKDSKAHLNVKRKILSRDHLSSFCSTRVQSYNGMTSQSQNVRLAVMSLVNGNGDSRNFVISSYAGATEGT